MLSEFDIEFMKTSVRDIIKDWNTTITILQPKSKDEQPNYNKLMDEFYGDPEYDILVVPAERKDSVGAVANKLNISDADYGMENGGDLYYTIPNVLNGVPYKPLPHSIIIIDDSDDRYYIHNMKDRIGETILTIKKYIGNKPINTDITEDNMPVDGLGED